ncbi:NUDIX hydrolase [Luteococcus peritonei]|uniref:NUDIX hydrolase n=1 Tax=Luteococcus peritonei TaxID=88874 RepID=A0ABW4RSW6_9ACTN
MEDATEEMVALCDEQGRVVGAAPRSLMRARNLRHAATGIWVTNSAGQVYVHRRTTTKDVYPGYHDFAAGGVLDAGETPLACAERELAEELGISGVPLRFIGETDYADEHVDFHAWLYAVTWDGPIRHQPSEVAWGAWVEPEEIRRMIEDPTVPVMPDSVAVWQAMDLLP